MNKKSGAELWHLLQEFTPPNKYAKHKYNALCLTKKLNLSYNISCFHKTPRT